MFNTILRSIRKVHCVVFNCIEFTRNVDFDKDKDFNLFDVYIKNLFES